MYRTNRLFQVQIDRRTGNTLSRRLVTHNDSRVMSEVDPDLLAEA